MPGSSGADIVKNALSLWAANPDWPAMQVLDLAVGRFRGSHPDFACDHPEYRDLLEPPSPFAELLRVAFDPAIEQHELQFMVALSDDPSTFPRLRAIEERWQRVIDRFGERYDLWPI